MTLAAAAPPSGLPFEVESDGSARVAWGQVIATPGDDWINDLVPLRNGNILGVGFLNRADGSFATDWQAVSVELQPSGAISSQRRYGDQGGTDAFWSMAEAADGRRVFGGFTTRVGPGGINGYTLVSQPDGAIIKENGFGYAGYDRFTDLAPAGDGFVFVGHSQLADQGAPRRTYIVKTDGSGLFAWERIYGGPEAWSALYIEPAGDGGFIIAGGTDGGGDVDMFVQKVDADGRQQWRKRIGTPDWDEVNHGLVVRPDGTIVLTGYTHRRGEESNDLVAATLSSDGEVQRIERLGGKGDDRAILAKADSAGRVWIVGHSTSAGAGGVDLLLARLSPDGAFDRAAITIGGTADDHGTAVLPMADGSLLLGGYSRGLGGGAQDAFVLRLSKPAWDRPNPAFVREIVKAP